MMMKKKKKIKMKQEKKKRKNIKSIEGLDPLSTILMEQEQQKTTT